MNFADPGVEAKDRTLSVHGNATYMIGNKAAVLRIIVT